MASQRRRWKYRQCSSQNNNNMQPSNAKVIQHKSLPKAVDKEQSNANEWIYVHYKLMTRNTMIPELSCLNTTNSFSPLGEAMIKPQGQ